MSGNAQVFVSFGQSMWPFLKSGEKLIVKEAPLNSLKLGDIILFRQAEKLVCHRLVKRSSVNGKMILYTRGEHNFFHKDPVEEEMLLGRVVGVFRNGKVKSLNGVLGRLQNYLLIFLSPLINKGVVFLDKLKKASHART